MHQLREGDLAILEELQRDAKISNADLAAKVGMAPSTCHGRVRALEEAGFLTGFHATVDMEKLGYSIYAMVSLQIHPDFKGKVDELVEKLLTHDEVHRVFLVSGTMDLMAEVHVKSVSGLRDFVHEKLSGRPAFLTNETSLIFDTWNKYGKDTGTSADRAPE